jgi:hypothetical protein
VITATYNFTKDDALALAADYYSTSPTVAKSRRVAHLACPIILVTLAATMVFKSPADFLAPLPLLIVAVLWSVFYPSLHTKLLLCTAQKMFTESAYEKSFGPCTLVFSEEGIHSSSPMGESKYIWSGVNRAHLTPTHLLIFLSGPMGFSIPRKQLAEATIQEIKSFSEEMIQQGNPTVLPNAGLSTKS